VENRGPFLAGPQRLSERKITEGSEEVKGEENRVQRVQESKGSSEERKPTK
jgi:hypothetical protein